MGLLKKLTDSIGLTRRVSGTLYIPIEISTNYTDLKVYKWPSGEKSFIPPGGIIEAFVEAEFTGEPLPVGTTIPIYRSRLPPFLEKSNDLGGFEGFSRREVSSLAGEAFFDAHYLKLPVISVERRDSLYYQECATLKFDMRENFDKILKEAWWEIEEMLRGIASSVTSGDEKFLKATIMRTVFSPGAEWIG